VQSVGRRAVQRSPREENWGEKEVPRILKAGQNARATLYSKEGRGGGNQRGNGHPQEKKKKSSGTKGEGSRWWGERRENIKEWRADYKVRRGGEKKS